MVNTISCGKKTSGNIEREWIINEDSGSTMSQTKLILLISEQVDFQRRLEKGLSGNAYIIKTTSSYDNKLKETVEQISPDLIIVDAAPPELKGIKLSLQIRSWSSVPLLMFSTLNTAENEIRILDVHADGWLSEPLGLDLISVRINDLLANPVV